MVNTELYASRKRTIMKMTVKWVDTRTYVSLIHMTIGTTMYLISLLIPSPVIWQLKVNEFEFDDFDRSYIGFLCVAAVPWGSAPPQSLKVFHNTSPSNLVIHCRNKKKITHTDYVLYRKLITFSILWGPNTRHPAMHWSAKWESVHIYKLFSCMLWCIELKFRIWLFWMYYKSSLSAVNLRQYL